MLQVSLEFNYSINVDKPLNSRCFPVVPSLPFLLQGGKSGISPQEISMGLTPSPSSCLAIHETSVSWIATHED